jgi:hypothetical protein
MAVEVIDLAILFGLVLTSEMGELGRRYAPRLVELGFGDLMLMLRMDDEDLEDVLLNQYGCQ